MVTLNFEVMEPLSFGEFIVEPGVFNGVGNDPTGEHYYFWGTAQNAALYPEPATLSLLTLGGLALLRRRRSC